MCTLQMIILFRKAKHHNLRQTPRGQVGSISAMSHPINQDTQLRRCIASRGLAAIQRLIMGKETLIHAALDGDIERVKMLLRLSVSTKIKDKDERTALQWATVNGHTAVVKMLLGANAHVDAQDTYNGTTLYLAAEKGHTDVVMMLLGANAHFDARDHSQRTALQWAAEKGHTDVVKVLLDAP